MRTEQALRLVAAAERRDWDGCRAAVQALIGDWPASVALSFGVAVVVGRLAGFERHEAVVAPRAWLQRVARDPLAPSTPALEDLWERASSGPGSANFLQALDALVAALGAPDAADRARHLTDAIAEAVMAGLVEAWGSAHPERWTAWSQVVQEDGLAASQIQLEMVNDPAFAAQERRDWVEIARWLDAGPPPA